MPKAEFLPHALHLRRDKLRARGSADSRQGDELDGSPAELLELLLELMKLISLLVSELGDPRHPEILVKVGAAGIGPPVHAAWKAR